MIKTLTILVDMDDTIEELLDPWLDYLNKKYSLHVTRDDVTSWDICQTFPMLTEEQVFEPLGDEELWKKVKPYPDAVEYLQRLIEDGHIVYIVTASHYHTIDMKLNHVLFKYFPFIKYDDIIIARRKDMIRGDVLIDDNPFNLLNGVHKGILFDKPHNQWCDTTKSGICRAYNWQEIYDIIQQMSDCKAKK